MTQLPVKVNFTNLGYDEIVAEIKTRIPFVIPEWKDFLDSNVGMGILRLVAYLVSIQTFYTDRQAAECFIDTALVPENIYRLVKLVGFQARGYYSAEGVARFTLVGGPIAQDVVLPEGLVVNTTGFNQVPFATVETAVISAGETQVEVKIVQGQRTTETFIADGTSQQKFQLGSKTAAFNSIQVRVNSSLLTEVPSFVVQDPTSLCYRVTKDFLDNVFIEFGDGREGFIPSDGTEIEVSYHDSIGTMSEIPSGSVSTLTTQVTDVLLNPVTLTVTNPDPISGGALPETPDDVKLFAPGVFRTQARDVTKADYSVEAERFPGVANTQVLDTTDDDTIPLGHVHIYLIGEFGITVDASFLASMLSMFVRRTVTTIRPRVFAATLVPIDVTLTINYFSSYNPETVRANVIKTIRDYMAPAVHPEVRLEAGLSTTGIKIGETVFASRFAALALAVAGVASCTVAAPLTDTVMTKGQIGSAGTITVSIGQAF